MAKRDELAEFLHRIDNVSLLLTGKKLRVILPRAYTLFGKPVVDDLIKRLSSGSAVEVMDRTPWDVLGIHPTTSKRLVDAAYIDRAGKAHPDRQGGSEEAMKELNQARDEIYQKMRWK